MSKKFGGLGKGLDTILPRTKPKTATAPLC